MEPISIAIGAVAIIALFATYRKFGKPWLKKQLDDPATEKDESAVFDPAVEGLIKFLVEIVVAQFKAKQTNDPKTPLAVAAVAEGVVADVEAKFGGVPGLTRAKIEDRINK